MHAVIFDIDGTLLQSASVDDQLYREAVRSVFGPVTFRSTLADYDFVTDSGVLWQLLDDNSIPHSQERTARVKSAFADATRSYIGANGPFAEVPGARKFLNALFDSKNHSVAVATGGWLETATLKLESAGFEMSQLPLATSDDSMDRNEILRIALSYLGSGHEVVTYYGDGPWDRCACESLGWKFVPVGPVLGGLESYDGIGVA